MRAARALRLGQEGADSGAEGRGRHGIGSNGSRPGRGSNGTSHQVRKQPWLQHLVSLAAQILTPGITNRLALISAAALKANSLAKVPKRVEKARLSMHCFAEESGQRREHE